jgi:putative aldouronate transport system permease protein
MFTERKKYFTFDYINTVIMLFISFIILYPIWYCLIYSFNEGKDSIMNGVFYWWPRVFSLQNYEVVFMDSTILQAFFITVLRTLTATFAHVFLLQWSHTHTQNSIWQEERFILSWE